MKTKTAICGILAVLLTSGCARFDPVRTRRTQTELFTSSLAEIAAVELAKPLSLEDCIGIAMRSNYEIRKADLNSELRRIGKNVAFTAFLPNVTASAGYKSYEKDPVRMSREYDYAQVDIGMPIFMPSTWFLYAAARHGYASAEMAAAYVRQGIVLETTKNYFNLLVQQETVAALESQREAARANADRIRSLAAEGYFAKWEGEQALFQAEARETELNRARRQLNVLRGDLLQGMGLSPAADIKLSGETGRIAAPEGTVDELVLKALEIHPELLLADRAVVVGEHNVRKAFCDFIPTVSFFYSGTWTGDDLVEQAENWVSGFTGVWKLFTGFANTARYKAAKVERRQSELERESTFLSIMVRVIAAEAALRDAAENARIRQRAYDVAAAKYADYDARAREGLIPLSEALDALAAMDIAQVELVRSRYQERIAAANLELAMGITLVPQDGNEAKEEK